MTRRTIDFSRYRLAEAIAERWEAGEDALSIAEDYFHGSDERKAWQVELIVAAHDRKGRHEPS